MNEIEPPPRSERQLSGGTLTAAPFLLFLASWPLQGTDGQASPGVLLLFSSIIFPFAVL